MQFATDLVISHKTVMMAVDRLDYRAGTNAAPVNGLQIARAAHGMVNSYPGASEYLLKRLRILSEIMRLSRQLRGCVQSYGGSKLPGKLRDRLQVFFYRLLIPLGIWRFRVIDHIIIHDNSCSIRHRPSGQTVLQT